MAELEEFFNRSSSDTEDESGNDDNQDKVFSGTLPKVDIFSNSRMKRHYQLPCLKVKDKIKYNSVSTRDNKPKHRPKIKLEDYNISHIIGKGATAVVKLGTHISKKTNVVFKIYEKEALKKTNCMKVLQEEIRIMK